MPELEIESFQEKYLDSLLECWNSSLVYDLINKERFQKTILLDENFDADLLKIAIVGNKVVGFCYGVKRKIPYLERGLEETRGWIVIMGVQPEYQNKNIGTSLCEEVENELKQRGTKEITVGAYSPNYFFPGIDKRYTQALGFFEKRNYFFKGEAVSMERNLWNYHMGDDYKQNLKKLKEEDITIIPYRDSYMHSLLEYLLKNFGAGWKRNALNAMQQGEAEETILLVLRKKEIIGFCMRKIDGNPSRFGPIGVNEELRSKGIGGVLFECMMEDMKKRGIYYAYFLWTSGAGQKFYERHHMNVYRDYKLCRKEFNS